MFKITLIDPSVNHKVVKIIDSYTVKNGWISYYLNGFCLGCTRHEHYCYTVKEITNV